MLIKKLHDSNDGYVIQMKIFTTPQIIPFGVFRSLEDLKNIHGQQDRQLALNKRYTPLLLPLTELLPVDIEESYTLKNKIFNAVPADNFELLLCDTEQRYEPGFLVRSHVIARFFYKVHMV